MSFASELSVRDRRRRERKRRRYIFAIAAVFFVMTGLLAGFWILVGRANGLGKYRFLPIFEFAFAMIVVLGIWSLAHVLAKRDL